MTFIEKHGGLWLDDVADATTLPVFEHYNAELDLLGVVHRSRSGHFVATLFEKSFSPQWSLPLWSDRRPEAIFGDEQSAIAHLKDLLQTAHVGRSQPMPILQWLFDSDPAIRWQVLRDLTNAPAADVAAERAKVATQGFGAALLSMQAANGYWGGAEWNHGWDSTMHVLTLLREFGLDPDSDAARRAVANVHANVHWVGWDVDGVWRGKDFVGAPYFHGEVEPCINGQVAAAGAYFRQDVERIIDRLVREQLPDGGWNCEAERGSIKSSFNTTLCVLDSLLEHEQSIGPTAAVTAARLRGQQYLLDRRLFHRKSTGEVVDTCRKCGSKFTQLAFPNWWHYDVLWGLDYLRRAGVSPDERMADAIQLLESKRDVDGRWRLDVVHAGVMPVDFGELIGQPSRWLTLRALRVLKWYTQQR